MIQRFKPKQPKGRIVIYDMVRLVVVAEIVWGRVGGDTGSGRNSGGGGATIWLPEEGMK